MSTTPEPTDDQLAAWLAGDLDADTDRAVTAAVRQDPVVAERAAALADVLTRLAQHAATPPPPPAPVDAILAAITAAADPAPGSPSPNVGTVPAGDLHRTSIRPPDDPTFTRRLERSPRSAPAASTRPGRGPGRRQRRDRVLSGVAVLALLALLATVGIQALRDGGPFGPPDPAATTTPDLARGQGQGAGEAQGDEEEAAEDSAAATEEPAGDALEGDSGRPTGTEDDDVAAVVPSATPPIDPDRPALPADEATTESSRPGPTNGDPAAGDDDAAAGGPGADAPDPGDAPQPAPRPPADPPSDDDQAAAPPEGDTPVDGEAGGDPEDAPPPPEEGVDSGPEMTSPTVVDSMVELPDAAAVQAHFANRPEAQQLMGLSGADARERAARHARDVGSSAPFAWGVHPSDCLDTATAGPGTTVIAAVESATYGGQRALAHLIVTGEDTLTRAFAVITDCSTCEVLLRVEVAV